MEIIIDDSSRLYEIEKEFRSHFPYLKLVFFGFELKENKIFAKENQITDTNKTLGEIRHTHISGRVSINGSQKVRILEQHFRKNFGVNLRVLKKSESSWVSSIAEKNWKLSELDYNAEEMNETLKEQSMGSSC